MIAEIEQAVIGIRNLERGIDSLVVEIKQLKAINEQLQKENNNLKEQLNDKCNSNSKESK